MKNSTNQKIEVINFFERTVLPELYKGKRTCDDLTELIKEIVAPCDNSRKLGRQVQSILEEIQDKLIIAKYHCIHNQVPVPYCIQEHQQFIDSIRYSLERKLEIPLAS